MRNMQMIFFVGKDEVAGSNPAISSMNRLVNAGRFFVVFIGVEGCAGDTARLVFM